MSGRFPRKTGEKNAMRVVPREHKISRPGTVVKKLFRDFLFEKAIRDRREREENKTWNL